jgi:hypothetical protein
VTNERYNYPEIIPEIIITPSIYILIGRLVDVTGMPGTKDFFGFRPKELKKIVRVETQQPTLSTVPDGSCSSQLKTEEARNRQIGAGNWIYGSGREFEC